MTRHILILVVFFSFLGVVLAQENLATTRAASDVEQEEHPGSVYINNPHIQKTVITNTNGISSLDLETGDEILLCAHFTSILNLWSLYFLLSY